MTPGELLAVTVLGGVFIYGLVKARRNRKKVIGG